MMKAPICLTAIALIAGNVALAETPRAESEDDGTFAPVDSIPEGYMIIEGDIVVPEDFFDTRGARATYDTDLWPGGIVPYVFDANVNATNQARAITAMGDWEAVANVDFRPRAGDENYLHIQNATFDASEGVGMAGGRHDIWIENWPRRFVIAHEFGHALGYWHEQSRADRNTACDGGPCIQINLENVCQTCCSGESCNSQFAIRESGGEYGPYDFDSVMHYGQCAFTSCTSCPSDGACTDGGRTITVLPPNDALWQNVIGHLSHLSYWDALVMSFLYPESDWRFLDRICQCWFGPVCLELGSFICPYEQFANAAMGTPEGGTLWVLRPGNYSAVGTYSNAMTIEAPLGGVVLAD
ncbi:MAG: hypothetical protein JSU86_03515 [Phycisphaerales bacterium]|nr:MAG: hypothetical protein JSU86_03515 [Phycisphaerales bacterium]